MSTEKAPDDLGDNNDMSLDLFVQYVKNEGVEDIDPESSLVLQTDPDKMDKKELSVDWKVNSNGLSSIPQQKQIRKINSNLSPVFEHLNARHASKSELLLMGPTSGSAISSSFLEDIEFVGGTTPIDVEDWDYPSLVSDSEEEKNTNLNIEVEMMTMNPTPGGWSTQGDESNSAEYPTPADSGAPTPGKYETPGADFEIYETKEEFEARITNWLKDHGDKKGDFYEFYVHRICFTLCTFTLLAIFVTCFILFPRPLELCLKFPFNDQDIETKVLGDKGGYELKISNPNKLGVDIIGLEIEAYFGGKNENNRVISAGKKNYHIDGYSNTTSVEDFKFTNNCIDAIPIATLRACSNNQRQYMSFDVVSSLKACLISFVCQNSVISESEYKSNCEKDDWVCTELSFSWWN